MTRWPKRGEFPQSTTAPYAKRQRTTALGELPTRRYRLIRDSRKSTHTRRMQFSGPLTGVLCKRPFLEFVAKIRIQRQRSSADIYRSCEQISTDRPLSRMRRCANDPHRPVTIFDSRRSTLQFSKRCEGARKRTTQNV